MKKYLVLLAIFIILIISFFLTQHLRVGNVVQETVIKEVIPNRLSKLFAIPWEYISIIESEETKGGWRCYFFALSSKQGNEFFIATVFDPPKEEYDQINYLNIAENICILYFFEIIGLENPHIIGHEVIYSNIGSFINVGFVVLRLKNIFINGEPLKKYL